MGARFRIELAFNPLKSSTKPFPGIISVWETAGPKENSLQRLIAFCPRCKQPIADREAYGVVTLPTGEQFVGYTCANCGTSWRTDEVIQFVGGNLTAQGWADLVEKYYHKLGGDVDIVTKRYKIPLRPVVEGAKDQQPKSIHDLRETQPRSYEIAIYPLERLIQDVSSGRDVASAVLAFIQS